MQPLPPAPALGEKRKLLKKVCEMLPALSQSSVSSTAWSMLTQLALLCHFPYFTLSRLFPLRTYSPPPSAELAFSSFRVQVKCHFHRKHFLTSDQVKSPGYILLQHHILPWKCFYIFLFGYLSHLLSLP